MPVFRAVCCVEIVKLYEKIVKILFMLAMVFSDKLFGGYAWFLGIHFYGGAMRIISAYEQHIIAKKLQESYKYVCLDVLN